MGRRFSAWIGLVAIVAVASACGYALAGKGNTLPATIRVIGVPDFVNQSPTPDVDRVLSEAVRLEFQGKGRYRVLSEATGADAVLSGTVTSVTLQPITFTADNQVSRYSIVAIARIEFKDVVTNTVIWSNPTFRASDEYEVTTGTKPNDANALFRQDANALERLSKSFARSVVTSIFEAF